MILDIPALLGRICGFTPPHYWARVNLDREAALHTVATRDNPFLNPAYCERFVQQLAEREGAKHTYGGYLEDRSFLWRDSYLTSQFGDDGFVHLGVDVNVPESTPIYCPVPFRVVEMFCDRDQNGGWGGRVVVETNKGALVVFAHLDLNPLPVDLGWNEPGDFPLGVVAPSCLNGGWFPHLHLQGLKSLDQLNGLDGYGPPRSKNAELYPEPLALLAP